MTKKKEDWMEFYNGRIPKRLVAKVKRKRKPAIVAEKTVRECHFCSNKSNEGAGDWRPDVGIGGSWVCSPCIKSHQLDEKLAKLEPKGGVFATMDDDNEDGDDEFKQLTPWEITKHNERQKSRNIWLMIFGVLVIAIILSLVERSRIFSVMAIVALIAVYLLYKYEVRI